MSLPVFDREPDHPQALVLIHLMGQELKRIRPRDRAGIEKIRL